jgi:hypothetical protein
MKIIENTDDQANTLSKCFETVEPSHQLDAHLFSRVQWPATRLESHHFAIPLEAGKLRGRFGAHSLMVGIKI